MAGSEMTPRDPPTLKYVGRRVEKTRRNELRGNSNSGGKVAYCLRNNSVGNCNYLSPVGRTSASASASASTSTSTSTSSTGTSTSTRTGAY